MDVLTKTLTDPNNINGLNLYLLDAFHTGSHSRWSKALQEFSKHNIKILKLPGRNWKWRMHGAAVSFAYQLNAIKIPIDVILVTDMTDLSTLIALTRKQLKNTHFYIYFHENQISYPWSPTDEDVKLKRDYHYAFINFTSALSADKVFFNSNYHLEAFIRGCSEMLQHFPDHKHMDKVEEIHKKALVLPLGLNLKSLDQHIEKKENLHREKPVILWNHRWEYDKNPELFFKSMIRLDEEGFDFELIVLGKTFRNSPTIFKEAKERLRHKISHFGYVESSSEYYQLLTRCNLLPVTNKQDFFGGSIVEAIYCGCLPILPDRLAYPEHIPGELQNIFFYNNDETFYPKVKSFIQDLPNLIKYQKTLRIHLLKYEWSNLISSYDMEFQRMESV